MTILKWRKPIKNKETGELHFQRFVILELKWFAIYLHYIYKADEDKHDHDHPWNFLSIILEGWYIDTANGLCHKTRKFGSIKYNKAEYHHKLHNLGGKKNRCVTLVFAGPRKRDWGYVTKSGWIENSEYRKLKKSGKLPE